MKIMYDYEILWLQKYGGISRYFYELSGEIRRKNPNAMVEIPVIAAENKIFSNSIKYKEWNIKFFERIVNEIYSIWKVMIRNIMGRPYEIVHPTFYLPLVWNRLINRKRTKLVLTVFDMTHEKYMQYDRRLIQNKRKLMEKADGIIAISENTKHDILILYPYLEKKKIRVIYLANGMQRIIPRKIVTPKRYILYVGNRNNYKNFETLLKAFTELKEKDKDIKLLCAGGETFTDEEIRKMRTHNIKNEVIYMPVNDEELAYLYKNAVCFVFPSLYEGFGIPILEAFYWKCPVVLSRCSCFPEIAQDAAIYFEGDDASDLACKIRIVAYDDKLRNNMKKRGTKRLETFSWERTAAETYAFYKELLNDGTGHGKRNKM